MRRLVTCILTRKDSLEDMPDAICAVLLAVCLLMFFATPLLAGDPHPPQLNVSFLATPAPIVQDGSTRLVYEMVITNFSNSKFELDAIEAKAGTAQFEFNGQTLANLIMALGDRNKPVAPTDRTLDAGRSLIIFLLLDLGGSKAPGG